MKVEDRSRYIESINAFTAIIRDEKLSNRSFDHECTVQETVVKASELSLTNKSIYYFSFFLLS